MAAIAQVPPKPAVQEATPKRTLNGLVLVAETNSDIREMLFVREALP